MTIKPLGNRLVVKLVRVAQRTSQSGIILSTKPENEQSLGEVIALGSGADVDGEVELKDLDVKVGNKVLFGKYSGEEVKDENDIDTVYKILKSNEILAVIEE
jgi:chaperonin GroES